MPQIPKVISRLRETMNNIFRWAVPSLSMDTVRWDEDLYVYHHLGLGDMIHCNGLVRHLVKRLDSNRSIHLFCKRRNLAMTRWMYRDEPRIRLVPLTASEPEIPQVQRWLQRREANNYLVVGHRALRPLLKQYPKAFFDQLFYLQVGIPYQGRFDECYWKRDLDEEERVFQRIAPSQPYAFVHDDPSRGYMIDTNGIDLPIVRNDPTVSIFHLGLVLERATQIHCMESSIRCMIESLDVSRCQLYYHNFRYPERPLGTATRHPWNSVEYSHSSMEASA